MSTLLPSGGRDAGPLGSDNPAYRRTLLGRLDRDLLQHRLARWFLMVTVGAVLVIPTIQFVRKIQQTEYSEYRDRVKHRTAVGRWLPDALALQSGGDPYGDRHWFPNPPLVLIALVPLAHLPIVATAIAWSLLKICALLGGCLLLLASTRKGGIAVPLGVMVMVALYSARPLMADITHGNINTFVFAEIALAWYLFVNRRDGMAGVIVALAMATKVTPGLLLVYFVYKRAWRVVAGAAVGLVLFMVVVPGLIVGFERNSQLLQAWFDLMVRPYVFHGFVTLEPKNQSLPGTLVRLLWYSGAAAVEHLTLASAEQAMGDVAERFGDHIGSFARPVSSAVQMLLRAANLAVVVLLAWACRTPLNNRRDPRLLLELSLVLIAMLLLSERTWKHHLTTFPIIYLATWWMLACYPWPDRFRSLFAAGLAVQFVLLVVIKGDAALFGGVITLGLLCCLLQNVILLRRLRRSAA